MAETFRSIGVGASAAGLAAAHHFNPDILFTDRILPNPRQSNEHRRPFWHPDHPSLWSGLVSATDEFIRDQLDGKRFPEEDTGYLIQVTPGSLPHFQRIADRISNTEPVYPFPLKRQKDIADTPPIQLWNRTQLGEHRKGEHIFIPPGWENAVLTDGGRTEQSMDALQNAFPAERIRQNIQVRSVRNAPERGKIILEYGRSGFSYQDKAMETITTSEAFFALGPWLEQLDLSQVELKIPVNLLPVGIKPELLPEKLSLPPGKRELHSIVRLNFTDEVIDGISIVAAYMLQDKEKRQEVLSWGILDPATDLSGIDNDQKLLAIARLIKMKITRQILAYGRVGPLMQNSDLAYTTRLTKSGDSRVIMLGRENTGEDRGDLNEFPPNAPERLSSAMGEEVIVRVTTDNQRRRDDILRHSKGILPPIDALLGVLDLLNSKGKSPILEKAKLDLSLVDFKRKLYDSMPIQSGFYHVTSGIEVTPDNFSQYEKLLQEYHEVLTENETNIRMNNIRRLKEAGIDDPEKVVDISYIVPGGKVSLCDLRYPFAVLSILNKYEKAKEKMSRSIMIPDVDLPYMDVVDINGALVSFTGYLRGRGLMAGAGAARVMWEKHRLIKEGKFDPHDDFGKYMSNFSILRLYNPKLMDELHENRLVGGSGDI